MKIKIIIIIILMAIFYKSAFAQLDENRKAKQYFTKAQKQFDKGDYKASIDFIKKAENSIGTKVAHTQALRIKIAYNLGNFIQAKDLFDDYTKNYMKDAPKELNDEVLAMSMKIVYVIESGKNQIFITVNGQNLEVYSKDLGEMKWQDAKDACNKLGAGWRLPTKDELEQFYLQLYTNGKGNFKRASYWSSAESVNYYFAWSFSFIFGRPSNFNKDYSFNVRAVRSL
jgi:hypothetical protein